MKDATLEQIIVRIIQKELCLNDQNVWVSNQNRKIPETPDIFIVVGVVDSKILSNNNSQEDITGKGIKEIQTVIARENVQIDIMSSDVTVLKRRAEVIMALASIYSIQQQERETFKIAQIPFSFVNTSAAEGSSVINRFTTIFPCLCWYRKEVIPTAGNDYFDTFDTRADDENTINTATGIIEFASA